MESLAVKYRPKTFSEVCSQESTIKILTQMLESGDFKNTFLFCGASGCGKTTVARIFANGINKGIGTPIEIDAASNNGVDNIREIVRSANERSVDSEYKIYIIDECHALTSQAWQAFLKCIEEPPQYTIFIFCTTDPQKIPQTILNRVMRFNFTRLSPDIVSRRLEYICKEEGFINYADACDYIARICNGGMRDAIALLEKCAHYNVDISLENVLKCTCSLSYDTLFSLLNSIIDGNEVNVLNIINQFYLDGNDLKLFVNQFLSFCLDVLKYYLFGGLDFTKIPKSYEVDLKNATNFDGVSQYYGYLVKKILELKNILKTDTDAKSTIEVSLLSMTRCD